MAVRLRAAMPSWLSKYPDFNTSKQYHSQRKCNLFSFVSWKTLSKNYVELFHSNSKEPKCISLTTASSISIPSNVMHAKQSKRTQQPFSKKENEPVKPKIMPKTISHNVKGFVLTRYIDYVRNYDSILKKNFPVAFKLYRAFFDGISDFYYDMKYYVRIWRIVHSSPKGLKALSLKELELYMQMPKDMRKVAPALIGTSLPIIGYVFFTLVFMYPRQLLTSHFWTPEQRDEFQRIQLQERFANNKPIVLRLQRKLKSIRKPIQYELEKILAVIEHESTVSPSCDHIMAVMDLFATPPLSLPDLKKKHIKLLCGMHGLSTRFRSRAKLKEHAFWIQHMDCAINREGGVNNMPLPTLEKACVIRGLNPAYLSRSALIIWLEKWIAISSSIQEQNISLLLHLPIFLAYNHPNNWKLYPQPKKGLKLKSD